MLLGVDGGVVLGVDDGVLLGIDGGVVLGVAVGLVLGAEDDGLFGVEDEAVGIAEAPGPFVTSVITLDTFGKLVVILLLSAVGCSVGTKLVSNVCVGLELVLNSDSFSSIVLPFNTLPDVVSSPSVGSPVERPSTLELFRFPFCATVVDPAVFDGSVVCVTGLSAVENSEFPLLVAVELFWASGTSKLDILI